MFIYWKLVDTDNWKESTHNLVINGFYTKFSSAIVVVPNLYLIYSYKGYQTEI